MKKYIALLILLLITLKLSAFVHQTDTVKSVSDSQKTSISTIHKDSLMSQVFVHYTENLDLAMLVHNADSLKLIDSVNSIDSIYQVVSLKIQDSIKWAQYKGLVDSVSHNLKAMPLDTLKQQLQFSKNDLFKGPIYGEIASRYMDYDTISNKKLRINYQVEALSFTMKALHQYSRYNDTLGLRNCFDNLAKVYIAQKKYPQAKWFILQSNTLSRSKHDTKNVVVSLITLSAIKSDLKDYALAMRDLNEAMQLSVDNKYPKLESLVLKNYGLLYSRMKNYSKEAAVLKKRDSLEESMQKEEDAKILASLATKDSIEKKKTDSVQNKKKVYTSNTKKLYKSNSIKKTASL